MASEFLFVFPRFIVLLRQCIQANNDQNREPQLFSVMARAEYSCTSNSSRDINN